MSVGPLHTDTLLRAPWSLVPGCHVASAWDSQQFACWRCACLHGAATFVACRQRLLRSLERSNGIEQRWALQSPQLLDGVAQLCLHRVRSLQAELSTCSSTLIYTEHLQEHIGAARKAHRALGKQLQRQRAHMRERISQLLGWAQQLRQYVQHLQPAHGENPVSSRQAALESVGLQTGKCCLIHIYSCA